MLGFSASFDSAPLDEEEDENNDEEYDRMTEEQEQKKLLKRTKVSKKQADNPA